MDQQHLSDLFEQGVVHLPRHEIKTVTRPWYSPAAWDGVFLKDLVTREETGGQFSYHLVRIQQGCEVADHNHDSMWEINMALSGNGVFILDGAEIPVKAGQTFATPPGNHHTVKAGSDELSLLALFLPALA